MDLEYVNWATPDLFHDCATIIDDPCPYPEEVNTNAWLYGVPTNFLGCESPYEGDGYAGAFFFIPNIESQLDGYREYLAVRLTEPMQAGAIYDVSMQVSLAERTTHAIWNIQVLFSADSLSQPTTQYMEYEPQLNGTPGDYIDNKDGWRELVWDYIAEGGEEFMYIGNFQPGSETDTLKLLDWDLWYFENSAYYFIDNVNVSTNSLSSFAPEIDEKVYFYPNPVINLLTVTREETPWEYSISSLDGRIIFDGRSIEQKLVINCSDLDSGIYLFSTSNTFRITQTQKIVKQ